MDWDRCPHTGRSCLPAEGASCGLPLTVLCDTLRAGGKDSFLLGRILGRAGEEGEKPRCSQHRPQLLGASHYPLPWDSLKDRSTYPECGALLWASGTQEDEVDMGLS